MERVGGGGPRVVFHVELFPKRREFFRDAVHKFLRLHARLLRALLDLLPVLIHAGEEKDFLAFQPVIPREHVGEHLFVGVADVRGAVGVVDGGGDEEGFGHGKGSGVPGIRHRLVDHRDDECQNRRTCTTAAASSMR